MKSTERLINRLISEGYLEPGHYNYVRSYAGYWQVKGGAWSFWIEDSTGRDMIGSQYTVKELLAAGSWTGDSTGSIYPG